MSRKIARELVFQGLYQMDIAKESAEDTIKKLLEENEVKDLEYFKRILLGVEENRAILDEKIQRYSKKWKVERLSKVDKAILRLATYEILFEGDIPSVVSINEGVELAKNFSGSDSPKFINGILDEIRKEVEEVK